MDEDKLDMVDKDLVDKVDMLDSSLPKNNVVLCTTCAVLHPR